MESKGIDFNKDTLRARVKKRRSINELESNQDKKAKRVLDSDDEDEDVEMDG